MVYLGIISVVPPPQQCEAFDANAVILKTEHWISFEPQSSLVKVGVLLGGCRGGIDWVFRIFRLSLRKFDVVTREIDCFRHVEKRLFS